jgi:hypothetical protein
MQDGLMSVDAEPYLTGKDGAFTQCEYLADGLCHEGSVLLRDPRTDWNKARDFTEMMVEYFAQPKEAIDRDIRPPWFQVGVNPGGEEVPLDYGKIFERLPPSDMPHMLERNQDGTFVGDPKRRFFRRMGPRPAETQFQEQNDADVIPAAFGNMWARIYDGWGDQQLVAYLTALAMLEMAWKLAPGTLTDLAEVAPHLMACNGVDLNEHGHKGKVFNGVHTDLNAISVHGPANFPGLRIWTRDWTSMTVSVPPGYLLVQAGQMLTRLTGGKALAGFHEVACLQETLDAMDRARGHRRLIRVSSSFFGHFASDRLLYVLPQFLDDYTGDERERVLTMFPPILAGNHVRHELGLLAIGTETC